MAPGFQNRLAHRWTRAARNLAVMKLARRPDPEPLETDDVRIVAAGAALWAVALVVLGVSRLAGADVRGWWLGMCAYGAGLGLLGVRYCQRRRDAIARDRAASPSVAESPGG
jgi:hypothetical protein